MFLEDEKHVHRNIKSGNILVSSEGVVKITDFGMTAYLSTTLAKLFIDGDEIKIFI